MPADWNVEILFDNPDISDLHELVRAKLNELIWAQEQARIQIGSAVRIQRTRPSANGRGIIITWERAHAHTE